ncbi:hypothetical protein HSX37_01220|uniref:Uncharacterized protein n=1 Tax=Dendrosporobacter quercicolus TaxID=146817 RepID=A0A1G9LDC3_9FIRM|nr:hypothetical protein [Dendrosporobacter quercicolus]NSL46674.1 hypothetical protein [Dendrosporobacter quercicolus DSM 1736]SDL59846.1 hypothetical protein SAMN04488502_101311 [Dendrosporobacter quercicolus]
MRSIAKKIMICSLLGLMQVGLIATVAAASPKVDEPPRIEQRNDKPRKEYKKVPPQGEKSKKPVPKKEDQKKLPPKKQQSANHDKNVRLPEPQYNR